MVIHCINQQNIYKSWSHQGNFYEDSRTTSQSVEIRKEITWKMIAISRRLTDSLYSLFDWFRLIILLLTYAFDNNVSTNACAVDKKCKIISTVLSVLLKWSSYRISKLVYLYRDVLTWFKKMLCRNSVFSSRCSEIFWYIFTIFPAHWSKIFLVHFIL